MEKDGTRSSPTEQPLSSHTLHGSESLCKLLRYLANHSMDHPGLSPKEYQIATEVFGRQKDFDPHLDSMVRVQAGRLRTKLAEYYASEGADDQIGRGTRLNSSHGYISYAVFCLKKKNTKRCTMSSCSYASRAECTLSSLASVVRSHFVLC